MKSLNPVPGRRALLLATLLGSAGLPLLAHAQAAPSAQPVTLLNVSYDVAREFYKDYNKAFLAHWKQGGGAEQGGQQQRAAAGDGIQ